MISQLSWSALILATIAALACWNPEAPPACHETRPVFGAGACCERHRVADDDSAHFEAVEAAWRASLPALP